MANTAPVSNTLNTKEAQDFFRMDNRARDMNIRPNTSTSNAAFGVPTQRQMNPLPVSSTGLSLAQNTVSPQRPQTAVSASTSSAASSSNSRLKEKDIEEIVESIGLISKELQTIIITKLKEINNKSNIGLSKKYLINFAGHPSIQYYILQKEKLFFQEVQEVEVNKKKYTSITSRNIKKHEIRDTISTVITNLLVGGPQTIGGKFEKDDTITGIIKKISPIYDPYFQINFSDIEVPMNLGDTCEPPKQKAGTRRRIKGTRITRRRLN